MTFLNPYRLEPAGNNFVGRDDVQIEWHKKLSKDDDRTNWLILASGGLGKTSLLNRLMVISRNEFNAFTIFLDFGAYRDSQNPNGMFESLETQLLGSPDFGTKVRTTLNLSPDSSEFNVILKTASTILQLAGISVNINPLICLSPTISNPIIEQKFRTEDIAVRIARFQCALISVTKRINRPIIIFIDQLGKAYDDRHWCEIARLLLCSILNLRKEGIENIIFVVALRPERYGLLDAQLQQQELFGDFLFTRKYLSPFSYEEACNAILKRDQAHIPFSVARMILQEIQQNGPLYPYAVIQASAAIWTYLYNDNHTRSPSSLDEKTIHQIVTQYYMELSHYFQQYSIQWLILKLLTVSSGYSIQEIVEHLNRSQVRATTSEVEREINNLLNQRGYQIISVQNQNLDSPRYTIAHELLREALLKQIPEEERLEVQAQKTLDDAIWRCQYQGDFLSGRELDIFAQFRQVLSFTQPAWDAITTTILNYWDTKYVLWIESDKDNFQPAITRYVDHKPLSEASVRGLLILGFICNDHYHKQKAMEILAGISRDTNIQLMALQSLRKIGDEQLAIDLLIKFIFENKSFYLISEACETLATFGKPVIDKIYPQFYLNQNVNNRVLVVQILSEMKEISSSTIEKIACTDTSVKVRRCAAEGLCTFGASELKKLTELINSDKDSEVRRIATQGLVSIGEKADNILENLFRYDIDPIIRHKAFIGLLKTLDQEDQRRMIDLAINDFDKNNRRLAVRKLIDLGSSSTEKLLDIARNDQDFQVRLLAIMGINKLGFNDDAFELFMTIFPEINDRHSRYEALEHLSEFGELSHKLIIDIAQNDEDEWVRVKAIELLAKFGESSKDILISFAKEEECPHVQIYAIKQLILGELSSQDVLIDIATNSKDISVREAAIEGLICKSEPTKSIILKIARKDKYARIRCKAIRTLSTIGESALEPLSDIAYKDKQVIVRRQATRALSNIGEPASKILIDLAKFDKDEIVRVFAIEGLRKIGDQALDALVYLLEDESITIKIQAMKCLLGFGDRANDIFINLAKKSDDRYIRGIAASAAVKIGDPKFFTNILVDLYSSNEDVKYLWYVANQLSNLGFHQYILSVILISPTGSLPRDYYEKFFSTFGLLPTNDPPNRRLSQYETEEYKEFMELDLYY